MTPEVLEDSGPLGHGQVLARQTPLRMAIARRPPARRQNLEARLVFALAGPGHLDAGLSMLGPAPSWDRLLGVASLEKAVFALHDLLRHAKSGRVPSDVQRRLAFMVLERGHHMHTLERRLEASLIVLNRAGIEPVLLKGAALAATVYRGFRQRPMNDIDLLVEAGRAREARELMIAIGWESHPSLPEAPYQSHHHLAPLVDRAHAGLRLEIHRALLSEGQPFRFSMTEIHAASVPIRIGSASARVLPPTEHAVHLAIHFAWSHMMNFGAWHTFRDLGTLDGAGLLDWDAFISTARRWRAASCCYWTLRLGRELAQLRVPVSVMRDLQPRLAASLLARIERHFTQMLLRADHICPSVRLRQGMWSAAIQPSAHGHNSTRPWSVSVRLPSDDAEAERPSIADRFLARIEQTRSLGKYVLSMI